MRICIAAEGFFYGKSGSLSGRICRYIRAMPEHEFVIWTVEKGPENGEEGQDMELPENVAEVRKVFPDRVWTLPSIRKKTALEKDEMCALQEFARGMEPDWETLFHMCRRQDFSPGDFLTGGVMHEIVEDLCMRGYPGAGFLDLYYTAGKLVLPALYLLGSDVLRADIYHAATAGYAGLLGRLGSHVGGVPFVLTEHGVYARKKEDETASARYMQPESRKLAASFFRMLSQAAYRDASIVTSMYAGDADVQVSEGCDRKKCRIIPGGIRNQRFAAVPPESESGYVDIGVISRIAPDGDLVTLLYAFQELKQRVPCVRLYITGIVTDAEYAEKCHALARKLMLRDVFFTGRIDMGKWIGRFDFVVLCSLSGEYPVELLESLAAGRPAVVTDVKGCRETVLGTGRDMAGPAGYCVPPMDREALCGAMERMCVFRQERLRMGQAARKRIRLFYRHEDMIKKYREVYREAAGKVDRNRI